MSVRHIIVEGDALATMALLPPASIDACITDPCYGETSCDWDVRVPGWPAAVRRVLKPTGSLWVFGSLRAFLETYDDFKDWRLAQDVVWEKHNGSGFCADRFKRVHELVVQFYPADAKWAAVYKDVQKVPGEARPGATINSKQADRAAHRGAIEGKKYEYTDERLMRSVIYARSMHGQGVKHETPKSPDFVDPIVRYSCPPGGVVLDPFCGSAQIGVSAIRNGREYIGIDNRTACVLEAKRQLEGAL